MKIRITKLRVGNELGLRTGDVGSLGQSKSGKPILKIDTRCPTVFHTGYLKSEGVEWDEFEEGDGLLFAVLIEGVLYGPFNQQEVGDFTIQYEATFEFCVKPVFQVIQLAKISGGDAAYLHIATYKEPG